MRLTVTIPLPPVALNPHAKGHWRPKAEATANHRLATRFLAVKAMGTDRRSNGYPYLFERVTVYATFYCGPTPEEGRYRPLDSTNAASSLKAAIDGLVDAGVVGADDHRHLRLMPPVLLRAKKEHLGRAEVVLEIEEWEAGS